ncbi:MAG TPA: hypothetical protein VLH61_05835 [Bacteroidales bacterium]|nr:hypothetical protein [Bacteroidales bacterium]
MKRAWSLSFCYLIATSLVFIFLLSSKSRATVPFSVVIESRHGTVLVAMHFEDASEIAKVRASLEQDLSAIEFVFMDLIEKGIVDKAYPRLVIEATKQFTVYNRFETTPTIISRANQVMLVCNNPDVQQFEPIPAGPAYVIETTTGLLNYCDILAMMLMLNELDEKKPVLEINKERPLEKKKRSDVHQKYMKIETPGEISHTGIGNYSLVSIWREGITLYKLVDETLGKEIVLDPVDVYITKPSWNKASKEGINGHAIGYVSTEQIVIYFIGKGIYFRQDIKALSPDGMPVQQVKFFTDIASGKIYAVATGVMGAHLAAYSIDLAGGGWQRTFQNMAAYQVSDLISSLQFEGAIEPFLPAFRSRLIRNADLEFTPYGGIDLEQERPRSFILVILLSFLLLIIAFKIVGNKKPFRF